MDDEWQERPKGQTLEYVTVTLGLLFGSLQLLLVVPGQSGMRQGLAAVMGVVMLALAWQAFRRARRLSE